MRLFRNCQFKNSLFWYKSSALFVLFRGPVFEGELENNVLMQQ